MERRSKPISIVSTAEGARLAVKVVPGASRDRIVGVLGDSLKVAVSKAPEGGAANRAVIALLAAELGIAARQLRIVKGQTNPRKEVLVSGIAVDEIQRRIEGLLKP
jgi:uncharacterized protein (TIGR00251 family)